MYSLSLSSRSKRDGVNIKQNTKSSTTKKKNLRN